LESSARAVAANRLIHGALAAAKAAVLRKRRRVVEVAFMGRRLQHLARPGKRVQESKTFGLSSRLH
jgi:hypothetical protein